MIVYTIFDMYRIYRDYIMNNVCVYVIADSSATLSIESGADSDTSSSKRTALSCGSQTAIDGDTTNWEDDQVSPC